MMTGTNVKSRWLVALFVVASLGTVGCHKGAGGGVDAGQSVSAAASRGQTLPVVHVDSDKELSLDGAIANLKKHGWTAEIPPEKVDKEDREVVMFISKARVVIVIARYKSLDKAKTQYKKINGSKQIIAERMGHTVISVKCGGGVDVNKCRKALADVI